MNALPYAGSGDPWRAGILFLARKNRAQILTVRPASPGLRPSTRPAYALPTRFPGPSRQASVPRQESPAGIFLMFLRREPALGASQPRPSEAHEEPWSGSSGGCREHHSHASLGVLDRARHLQGRNPGRDIGLDLAQGARRPQQFCGRFAGRREDGMPYEAARLSSRVNSDLRSHGGTGSVSALKGEVSQFGQRIHHNPSSATTAPG